MRERHALEGQSDEGRHPHDPQSFRRHRRLDPDARQTNGLLEAINGLFQAAKRKARGIYQPHDHAHRAVSDRRQARLLEDQPTYRVTHSFFKRAR
ncbi:MAG: hypothetical protein VB142_03040 [Burkholderia sp.]